MSFISLLTFFHDYFVIVENEKTCPDDHPLCQHYKRAIPVVLGIRSFQRFLWKHSPFNGARRTRPGQTYFSKYYTDLELLELVRGAVANSVHVERRVAYDRNGHQVEPFWEFGERRWRTDLDDVNFFDALIENNGKFSRVWDVVIELDVPNIGYFFRGDQVFYQNKLKIVVRNGQFASIHPHGVGVNPRRPNERIDPQGTKEKSVDVGPENEGHEYYALKTSFLVSKPNLTRQQKDDFAAFNPRSDQPSAHAPRNAAEAIFRRDDGKSGSGFLFGPPFRVPAGCMAPRSLLVSHGGVVFEPVSTVLLPSGTYYKQAHPKWAEMSSRQLRRNVYARGFGRGKPRSEEDLRAEGASVPDACQNYDAYLRYRLSTRDTQGSGEPCATQNAGATAGSNGATGNSRKGATTLRLPSSAPLAFGKPPSGGGNA